MHYRHQLTWSVDLDIYSILIYKKGVYILFSAYIPPK